MIQLFNVSKVYSNGVKALSDINLEIEKGEFLFIVGASGAGKSSFIKLLIRDEIPTKGQIMIGGRSILRLKRSEVPHLRRKIGVVFQDYRLLENRTVFENVSFALEVLQCPSWQIKPRALQVLQMVGLSSKCDAFPAQLSGGEQQRVAIARAIINTPRILVADEPTGNLDPDNSKEILKILYRINKLGTTVIVATHDQEMVDSIRKRVIALEKGRIVRDDLRGAYRCEA